MARKLPEIPSASLADIAFMILIFFLVTATMNTDFGLERRLPPFTDSPDDSKIHERNIFVVLVDANNRLMVEGELMDIGNLREEAKIFMANPNNNPGLSEKEVIDVPLFGAMPVTKGVISLQNHVGTQYGMYLRVQNELVAAINDLRNEFSMQRFGKNYLQLTSDQQEAIRKIYPSNISEAEPRKVGGK